MADVLRVIAGIIFNWFFRGGGCEAAFLTPRKNTKFVQTLIRWGVCTTDGKTVGLRGGRYINSVAYAIAAFLCSHSAIIAGCALIGMTFGQLWGWGDYLDAMYGQSPKHGKVWGVAMMSVRGLIWGVSLTLPQALASHWVVMPHIGDFMALSMIVGVLMGLVYWTPIWVGQSKWWHQNTWFNQWTAAEMTYGAMMWSLLRFLGKGNQAMTIIFPALQRYIALI